MDWGKDMSAQIIDGKARAAELRARVADAAATLQSKHGLKPGLAVVLVGDNPASEIYVRNKARETEKAGMHSVEHRLPGTTSEAELLALIDRLNADTKIHGILVQLPLPKQISADRVVLAIDPRKDVDGLHPLNAGLLAQGKPALVPCTPQGCLILLKETLGNLAGRDALVVGRSILVGRPMVQLLLNESCTVTVAHSKTRDLEGACRRADILVAAIGKAELVRGSWIKKGATIMDVGINRLAGEGGKPRLVGDVAYDEALPVAGAITPVPGGIGPMTIACLLRNTVLAACAQASLPAPSV
jgi:methylenetetrahydrofolate dehydrogenase (NADP+)/methenyltetrahydrofolate cyclohydrolase